MDRLDAYMGGAGIEVFFQPPLDLIFVNPHNHGIDKAIATNIVEIIITLYKFVKSLSLVCQTDIAL